MLSNPPSHLSSPVVVLGHAFCKSQYFVMSEAVAQGLGVLVDGENESSHGLRGVAEAGNKYSGSESVASLSRDRYHII